MKSKVEQLETALESKHQVELTLFYRKDPESIKVSGIVVPKGSRSVGIGSAVMEAIADFADEFKIIVVLSPATDFGGTSVNRLRKFYGQFGFKRNLGRHKNFQFSETMIRVPPGL